MSFRGRRHSSETRAKIAAALVGKPHPHRGRSGWRLPPETVLRIAEKNRIQWTQAMDDALVSGIRAGRSMFFIAEDIGVAEKTAANRADVLGLPRRRRGAAA